MGMRYTLGLVLAVALAGAAMPAAAGDGWRGGDRDYWDIRDAIYQRVNLIARLEANPDVDETVKGPAITRAHVEIRHLRAMLGPPLPPHYYVPCCYERRPLYFR